MDKAERAAKQQLWASSQAEALAMFARAPSVRFAGVDAQGKPVLRTLSAVVVDGAICFHGADDGHKLELVGTAIASCDELVAQVASYWIHPELACPASTYYLSAIAEGEIHRIDDLTHKANVMRALMERFQPEGGYVALDDKRYRKVLESLFIAELRPTSLSAKHKLGQHRSKSQVEGVLAGLWDRGGPGDLRAIRLIREAHPERPLPAFLRGPQGSVLCVAPDADDAVQVAQLLEGQYWTAGMTSALHEASHRGSSAWVVARDEAGKVVASARAVSDGARFAYVMDVVVAESLQRQGYGRALNTLLLAHPALRKVRRVTLRTRTPDYYRPFGFAEAGALANNVELALSR